ncbi:active regulator of SIRT1-like [Varroa destructor]|uniref:40S ribosomal protein S19-binding protein 1 n=1 Tax=Varroa destructor TaxID=109461 RepID=A0A7M7JTS7_VARDE|nr:active regulator of SIRT1-like [Varroa destructor]
MSLSVLKKAALLMGDLEHTEKTKKSAAKQINRVKLVKLSSIEKRTRKLVEEIRKKRQKNYMKANIERIKRYSTKIDSYSKKILSNDLVRERLFKNNRDFISVKDSDKDKEEETSVFTDEDFKRFEEEYNIHFTKRAKERAEFRKMLN